MKEFKIEVPKGFEVDKENSTFERIIFKEVSFPMDKVFKYHKTSQQEFDELYKNLSRHVKAFEKECMIVSFYNKGWTPDFNNPKERKWYVWFYLDVFRLNFCYCCSSYSVVPARLLWKNEQDLREAVEIYKDVFKENREFN